MSLPAFFFDRVSAEIRQQMDDVLALADQLSRQRLTADAQACVLGVAEAAAGVRRTLDSALDLKAVTADGLVLKPAPLRLRELMDALQDRWSARARQCEVTLLVSYAGEPEATVLADRERLLQVFDGFLAEAVAGSARAAVEASLKVSVLAGAARLEGCVRGARSPAPPQSDEAVRVRAVADRLGLGVALDVMLARRIVAGLDGLVRDQSGPGAAQTTTFELTLPVAADTPATPVAEPGRSAHILIVDDNATNRVVAQALCEMFNCTTETAEDGFQAVEAARSARFDLILMDIRMPGMDGVTATREIRALPGRAGVTPIIALTANADPDEARGYLQAGMLSVIEKPMKAEHLRAALTLALEAGDARAA
ncbi:response regulator [Phenylobacterium sp.]|jgi:CheY-like chemotaxis protein|uniref:response regulator n=1 Tax=Phenylobacterium sp. TaxID=1871053 RepID=UPI002F927AED